MYDPVSTYRIQFSRDFNLKDFARIIPYLKDLGIRCIYASPVFHSTEGSSHGYDSLSPDGIDPEIGTEEEFEKILDRLAADGIGWLQDIVPNHMAYDIRNPWMKDVLKNGKASAYYDFFDMQPGDDQLMAPFLGEPLDELLKKGQVNIIDEGGDRILVAGGIHFPVNDASTSEVSKTLQEQFYRPCHWKETNERINYRRFFTVNDLICLNMQSEKVFRRFHEYITGLVASNKISGLRIDHIDGLYDPVEYAQRLRATCGDQAYIVAEKILSPDEDLPYWPIQGTTGYDFLAHVNAVLTNGSNRKILHSFYRTLVQKYETQKQLVQKRKRRFLHTRMAGELQNLCALFQNLEFPFTIKEDRLQESIAEILIRFPVYRLYGNSLPLPESDKRILQELFQSIRESNSELVQSMNDFSNLFLKLPDLQDTTLNRKILHFYRRLMQFTGPLMAKGFEDTFFYTFVGFITHNEVGDSPDVFSLEIPAFHKKMIERQRDIPMTMNTTATHDTKRGEDARARLNIVSNLPQEWFDLVRKWIVMNSELHTTPGPDKNEEYFLYQSMLATYPFEEDPAYVDRLKSYMRKSLREASQHSDWTEPDEQYEQSTLDFIDRLFDSKRPFLKSFLSFAEKISELGIINSLSQVVLKYLSPGIPDLYQGTELFDFSFVDPDNRRPVDYTIRKSLLKEALQIKDDVQRLDSLWKQRRNGGIKLWYTHILLQLRIKHSVLFSQGSYVPLEISGKRKNELLAFRRTHQDEHLVAVVPVHVHEKDFRLIDWKDTVVRLPGNCNWLSVFDGKKYSGNRLQLNGLFSHLPHCILKST